LPCGKPDALIATFPEVHHVFGKVGRAETATDPAPLSMIETTIMLEQDKSKWRKRHFDRWFAFLPEWIKHYSALHHFWPEERPITIQELSYGYEDRGEQIPGLNDVVAFPGLTNSWTMPIRTRIDMLSTGIKTPVGIKVAGPDLQVISKIGQQIEGILKNLPGTASAYSERVVGGRYIEIDVNREAAARYNMNIEDVDDIVSAAIGGANVAESVEGLERYPVNLRFPRDYRDSVERIRRLPVVTRSGAHVPLSELADIQVVAGPGLIRSENARLNGWIYVDIEGSDLGSYVAAAKAAIAQQLDLPAGYSLSWSGQFRYLERAKERLKIIIPITLVLIVVILYIAFRRAGEVAVVLLTLPLALAGGLWLLFLLQFNLSIAVGVGFIALSGVAVEISVVMLMFLNTALENRQSRADEEG